MAQNVMKQLWDNRITKHNLDAGALAQQGKSKTTLVCVNSLQNTYTMLLSLRISITHSFWSGTRGSHLAARSSGAERI